MFRPPTPAPGSPDTDMNIDHIVKLFVTGGKTQTLHCRSKVPQSVCTLDCTKVDFGMVAVGAEATAEAVLTNTGMSNESHLTTSKRVDSAHDSISIACVQAFTQRCSRFSIFQRRWRYE